VKAGDILIAIDDKAIDDSSSMLDTVANLPPGKMVMIKLLRNGATMNMQVKIGKRPRPVEE
jgi:serine protease DegQ